MQIVIDIPEKYYKDLRRKDKFNDMYLNYYEKLIVQGKPLPKVHGRLIDADAITKEIKGYIIDTSNLHYDDLEEADACNSAYYNCLDEIEDKPTIIEADKESEEVREGETNGRVD